MSEANKPRVITYLFGDTYTGPFSNFAEWHAFEYGVFAGFYVALTLINPDAANLLIGLLGIRYSKNILTGDVGTKAVINQVKREFHYAASGVVLSFFATTYTIGSASLPSVLSFM